MISGRREKGYHSVCYNCENFMKSAPHTRNCVNTPFAGIYAVVDKTLFQCYIIAVM